MVRKTHHGRPGTQIMPDDWGERLSPAANQLHTSECEIRGPDVLGVFDPVTGAYDTEPGPLRYSGACRVQRVREDQVPALVTEQALASVKYRISIDFDANTVEKRDLVTITSGEDTQLVGQTFPVMAVVHGSLRTTRDLFCTDDLSV